MTRSLSFALLLAAAACQPRSTSSPAPNASGAGTTHTTAQATPGAVRVGTDPGHAGNGTPLMPAAGHELAAFAEGCFWGSENTFRHVPGVVSTAVGYTGGHSANPTYEDVSAHGTGHAEAVLVEFDPKRVSYAQLLHAFFESHDPTTKNRQGPDVGDQYRSAIFTFSEAQAQAARSALAEEQKHYKRPITTAIGQAGRFYKAEGYHQQYDEKAGFESCPLPIRPSRT